MKIAFQELLVQTTDPAHAAIATWGAPQFLTFGPGEKLHYSCSYTNPGTSTITVGTSALNNETCMAIGYHFPAASQPVSCY